MRLVTDRIDSEIGAPLVLELYRSVGYELTESYGQYRDHPDSRCFTKLLR